MTLGGWKGKAEEARDMVSKRAVPCVFERDRDANNAPENQN